MDLSRYEELHAWQGELKPVTLNQDFHRNPCLLPMLECYQEHHSSPAKRSWQLCTPPYTAAGTVPKRPKWAPNLQSICKAHLQLVNLMPDAAGFNFLGGREVAVKIYKSRCVRILDFLKPNTERQNTTDTHNKSTSNSPITNPLSFGSSFYHTPTEKCFLSLLVISSHV